jgi:hypothetical protein
VVHTTPTGIGIKMDMRMLHNGSASVFQTDGESSILSIRSNGLVYTTPAERRDKSGRQAL